MEAKEARRLRILKLKQKRDTGSLTDNKKPVSALPVSYGTQKLNSDQQNIGIKEM